MVFFKTPSILKNLNIERKLAVLAPVFTKEESVLDFGCGDLSLAKALKSRNPSLTITGVDVVSVKDKPSDISFFTYNGSQLPFKDRTFDLVLCFYVLHHCSSPEFALGECARVARKSVIIIESVPRNTIEVPIMGFVDWIFNAWKIFQVPITFKFYSKEKWEKLFKKYNLRLISEKSVKVVPQPPFLPLGKSYLFLCQTKHSV